MGSKILAITICVMLFIDTNVQGQNKNKGHYYIKYDREYAESQRAIIDQNLTDILMHLEMFVKNQKKSKQLDYTIDAILRYFEPNAYVEVKNEKKSEYLIRDYLYHLVDIGRRNKIQILFSNFKVKITGKIIFEQSWFRFYRGYMVYKDVTKKCIHFNLINGRMLVSKITAGDFDTGRRPNTIPGKNNTITTNGKKG